MLSTELSYVMAGASVIPLPVVHHFTQDYVSRIFRLHDDTKVQDIDSLTNDETLLVEKISFTGRKYYNTKVKVSELRTVNERAGFVNWRASDTALYVKDDIGGIKMDRIWGIAEHNSGIDNGRYFGK